jgi:hypothetical protein
MTEFDGRRVLLQLGEAPAQPEAAKLHEPG